MSKKIITICIFIFTSALIFAQANVEISEEKVLINGQKYYIHTVSQGQTLYSICKAYSVPEKDVLNSNIELQTGILSVGQTIKIPIENEISKDGKHIIYLVKKGETLYSLLKRFSVTETEFYEANPKLSRDEKLKVEQEIYFPIKEDDIKELPKATVETTSKETEKIEPQKTTEVRDTAKYIYVTIEKGETIYRLTKTYNVSQDELIMENPDLASRSLILGETIRILKKEKSETAESESKSEIKNKENVQHSDTSHHSNTQEVAVTNISANCDQSKWYKHGNEFTIAILLPFDVEVNMKELSLQENTKKPQRLRPLTERIIDFYSGCLVELEKFKSQNVNITLKVYDIGQGTGVLSSMVKNKSFNNVDMIIGPAFKSQIEYLNAQNLNIPLLLPFVTDQAILQNHANNITIRPSHDVIYSAVANYVKTHPEYNVIIVENTSESSKKAATKYLSTIKNIGATAQILKFEGSSISAIDKHLSGSTKNIIILTFEEEMIINRTFTHLFPFCKEHDILVIGDQKITNYENIDPSYYSDLKYSYCSFENINYNEKSTSDFISNFRDVFLCEPGPDAYLGADAIGYFIPLLHKAGKNFTSCIDTNYIYNGYNGKIKYTRSHGNAANSYSNNTVYIYSIQSDYTLKMLYPTQE